MTIDPAGLDLRHHGDAEVGPGLVDFAVNVRPGTPPGWLARRLRESIEDLAAYPDAGRARAALARRHGRAGRSSSIPSSPSRRRRCAPPDTNPTG